MSAFVEEDLLGTGGGWLLTQGFWKVTKKRVLGMGESVKQNKVCIIITEYVCIYIHS